MFSDIICTKEITKLLQFVY